MRCEDARLLISAGLDGESTEASGVPLEAHLATCLACQRERIALAGTVQWLREVPEAEPPAALRGRIAVALMEEERRAQRRHLSWTWLARPQTAGWAWGATAGAMLAAVALVTTHSGGRGIGSARSPHPVSTPYSFGGRGAARSAGCEACGAEEERARDSSNSGSAPSPTGRAAI